ncbi:MAG: three-Cys-motif partner protein TcmP [Acetobacterium sp.]|uniref:three-Cys-motif partner protein TcmP n=1 Tax=Acetobacterium sp. TaxID=1872094 RepID=UPI003242A992
MDCNDFYSVKDNNNTTKTLIVKNYFPAWAKIMKSVVQRYPFKNSGKLAYVDFFSGPGAFEDGEKSTPILIMEHILNDRHYCQNMLTFFNDCDENNILQLKENLKKIDGYDLLENKPQFFCDKLSTDSHLHQFANLKIPTLYFIDPFGYKGLSQDLFSTCLGNFGCDAILFFNYNRIQSGLLNPKVEIHMRKLFSNKIYEELKKNLKKNTINKEEIIIEAFSRSLKENNLLSFPFRFEFENRMGTSHYIIFITHSHLALNVMKEIMHSLSSTKTNGIANFSYVSSSRPQQLNFIDISKTEELRNTLKQTLLKQFSGYTIKVKNIIDNLVETIYTSKNIKVALIELELEGLITCPKHRANTMADHLYITFPQNMDQNQTTG